MMRTSWACVLCTCKTAAELASRRWCAFAVTSLAPQRLVGGSRRRTTAPVRVIDVVFHVLVELFEEKGSLKAHLLDTAAQTLNP
jgi:hypothetical protein